MTNEYWVADSNLDDLRKEIARLVRKAARLGLPEPTLLVTDDTRPAEYVARWDPCHSSAEGAVNMGTYWARPVTVGYMQRRVVLDAESPSLEGWTWIATIDHMTDLPDDLNLVDAGAGVDAARWERTSADCDHCGWDRRRKWTYILDHEDGSRVQVGRTCLKDFIPGANDPHRVADYSQALFATMCSLGADCDDMWREPMEAVRRSEAVLTERYLAWAISVSREDGWLSRGLAWERYQNTSCSTADNAWNTMLYDGMDAELRAHQRECRPTAEDEERARVVLEWAREELEDADNDYLANLHLACLPTGVTSKRIGLVASAPRAYDRAMADAERAARRAEAEPVPVTDDRVEITARIIKLDLHVNDYGSREVMTVEHEDGWRLWGTQPRDLYGASEGDVVRFTARVEPSDDDPKFGFFKRPTKAAIIQSQEGEA